jgi:hypothetical protein
MPGTILFTEHYLGKICGRGGCITTASDHTLPWVPGCPNRPCIYACICNARGIVSTARAALSLTPSSTDCITRTAFWPARCVNVIEFLRKTALENIITVFDGCPWVAASSEIVEKRRQFRWIRS